MKRKALMKELRDEINQIKVRNPRLRDDAAFLLWFLQAELVELEDVAKRALTGDTGDKNFDGIYVDDKAEHVNIVQGKYREFETYSEKRNDVLSFADLSLLPWQRKSELEAFYSKLEPLVEDKVKEFIRCVRSKKYAIKLFYVTTGRCSDTIIKEAKERVRNAEGPTDIRVLTNKEVLILFKNFQADVIPRVPPLALRILSEGPILKKE